MVSQEQGAKFKSYGSVFPTQGQSEDRRFSGKQPLFSTCTVTTWSWSWPHPSELDYVGGFQLPSSSLLVPYPLPTAAGMFVYGRWLRVAEVG